MVLNVNAQLIKQIDVSPFAFSHDLCQRDALSEQEVSAIIKRLPKEQVFFTTSKSREDADFDQTLRKAKQGISLEQALENMATAQSFIVVRSPERDPAFAPVYEMIRADIATYSAQIGHKVTDATLYMFVSSPNCVTPFHIDRYSTFLMQIKGNKSVYTWPSFDYNIVDRIAVEDFMCKMGPGPKLLDASCPGTEHVITPGTGVHIPYIAPHMVKTTDEVSISLSVIFNTTESDAWTRAFRFNYLSRKKANGNLSAVKHSGLGNLIKSGAIRVFDTLSVGK